jgi:molecular chaperone HtpG
MKEEKEFQTESKELLNLMINSIYSNREIFLRELISNGSDAIDKYRYTSLTSEGKYPQKDYKITIKTDKKERYIEVDDNGIGMDKESLEKNLGTIARSGSKEFFQKFKDMKEKEGLDLIGQFGVGFYSAFMVAKKVEVRTKSLDGKGWLFASDGVDKYSIEDVELPDIDTGSQVRVYLKDDTDDIKYSDYLEDYQIESLVKKYSDYIRYPIQMNISEQKPKLGADGKAIEGQYDNVVTLKTLNSMIPLWKKAKNDVTDKDLAEFYKSKFDDYEDPLFSLYVKAEGLIEYDALIFVPAHAPANLYSENYEKGLALYSKGIFIQDKCKELVPDYLKFVKGLVDSEDFPLNISREMLQKSPILTKIASNIEAKVLAKLADLKKNDYDKYLQFFKVYGNHLKYGIYSSYGIKKDELQDLLVFPSLKEEKPISLADYKSKMAADQKFIYYAAGKTVESIKLLPQMEKYKKGGVDVLLLAEPIDEFTLMMMHDYAKTEFKSISEDTQSDLTQEEKLKLDGLNSLYSGVLANIKSALKDKVDEVSFSTKLVDSPVCLTNKEGLSMNMADALNSQPGHQGEEEEAKAVKVLEINPDHPLFKAIATKGEEEDVKKFGSLLYDEAMLLEGFEISDKEDFVSNLNQLMLKALGGSKSEDKKAPAADKKAEAKKDETSDSKKA